MLFGVCWLLHHFESLNNSLDDHVLPEEEGGFEEGEEELEDEEWEEKELWIMHERCLLCNASPIVIQQTKRQLF